MTEEKELIDRLSKGDTAAFRELVADLEAILLMVRLGRELAKAGKPEYEAMIQALEDDQEADVKLAALIALADEQGGVPVNVLTQIWKEETDPEMKRMLVMTLGQTKSDEAVPTLLEAARDKDRRTATAAVMALGQIGTPKAKAALLEIIEKREPEKVKKDVPE